MGRLQKSENLSGRKVLLLKNRIFYCVYREKGEKRKILTFFRFFLCYIYMTTTEKGRLGEQKAEAYLVSIGYTVLCKNYRQRYGEIDLIIEDPKGTTIVFVEIKTWNSFSCTDLEYSINYRKQYRIKKTSIKYLYTDAVNIYKFIRYDVILIHKEELTHIKGAF